MWSLWFIVLAPFSFSIASSVCKKNSPSPVDSITVIFVELLVSFMVLIHRRRRQQIIVVFNVQPFFCRMSDCNMITLVPTFWNFNHHHTCYHHQEADYIEEFPSSENLTSFTSTCNIYGDVMTQVEKLMLISQKNHEFVHQRLYYYRTIILGNRICQPRLACDTRWLVSYSSSSRISLSENRTQLSSIIWKRWETRASLARRSIW